MPRAFWEKSGGPYIARKAQSSVGRVDLVARGRYVGPDSGPSLRTIASALGLVEQCELVIADPSARSLQVAFRVPHDRNIALNRLAIGPEDRLAVETKQRDRVGSGAECDYFRAHQPLTVWVWCEHMLANPYLQG